MNYTKIRDAIEETFRDQLKSKIVSRRQLIGDKTFSRGLASLLAKGSLDREQVGREVQYSLSRCCSAKKRSVAVHLSNMTFIEQAKATGFTTSGWLEGWSFYGLPADLGEELTPVLQKEARRFRDAIVRLIKSEYVNIVREFGRLASKKVSESEVLDAAKALYTVFNAIETLTETINVEVRLSRIMESWSQGASDVYVSTLRSSLQSTKTFLRCFEDRSGLSSEEQEELTEILGKCLEDWYTGSQTVLKVLERLEPEERDRIESRISTLMLARSNICAVIC